MHEILAATKTQLMVRKAELHDLIAAAEQRGQDVADHANAEIARLKAAAEAHVEELTGIQHSLGTLETLTGTAASDFKSEAEAAAAERQKIAQASS